MISEHKLNAMVENIGDFIMREDRMPLLHEIAQLIGRHKDTARIWLNLAKERGLIDWCQSDRFYYIRGIYFEDKRISSFSHGISGNSIHDNTELDPPLQG